MDYTGDILQSIVLILLAVGVLFLTRAITDLNSRVSKLEREKEEIIDLDGTARG